ncbi:MAG TPA: type VI secretion system tip protein VgrG [Chitinophagales bacterium]|nr:type VI secretion system tip protein VgrG [Chitinophagales bacterium]HRK26896.1 type VI secretion system tip protein VgrG [Chitinophagales bacterium]
MNQQRVAEYRLFSDGMPVPGNIEVLAVSVFKNANKVTLAKITIAEGDADRANFENSGSNLFRVGNTIEIQLGFDNDLNTVFEGIVVNHAISVRPNLSRMEITCMDESVKMTISRKSRYFEPQTSDTDAINLILADNGLTSGKVENTPHKHPQLVQYNATDWDFICTRADSNGLLVSTDFNQLSLLKPKLSAPKAKLVFGTNIYELDLQTDGRFHYQTINAKAWQPAEQKMKDLQAQTDFSNDQGDFSTQELADALHAKEIDLQFPAALLETELTAWANALQTKSELAKIRGRISIEGTHKIQVGDTIEIAGAGEQFNGTAYVTGIAHTLASGNWKCDVQVGLPPEWFTQQHPDLLAMPAEGLLPAASGLHIGIVTKLEGDPDNEFRIKVRMPTISENEEGVWVRIATLDAGKERGTVFRPEINDEVVIGFLNGDPRFPVLLGMLHSSKHPAPIEPKDLNHEKGYTSRSKMQLHFNDEKNIITIKTPKGNTIILNDEKDSLTITDSNKNEILMHKEGINITCIKDINIKAEGNITVNGNDITLDAKAKFTAKAQSGAELSTSAIAVIKGSTVQIN